MNYHNITTDDMKNGPGLRVVVWLAGCEHFCDGCQNPVTWDPDDGIPFDANARREVIRELGKTHISGITFSGGDPFHPVNKYQIMAYIHTLKTRFPNKTIWIYTGYDWEQIKDLPGMNWVDVVVDGAFDISKKDNNYHWAGSTNQRVIDVPKSLKYGRVILHAS